MPWRLLVLDIWTSLIPQNRESLHTATATHFARVRQWCVAAAIEDYTRAGQYDAQTRGDAGNRFRRLWPRLIRLSPEAGVKAGSTVLLGWHARAALEGCEVGMVYVAVVFVFVFVVDTVTAKLVCDTRSVHAYSQQMATVFISTAPDPSTGYMQILPLDEVSATGWSVEEAVQVLISGGILSPPTVPFDRTHPIEWHESRIQRNRLWLRIRSRPKRQSGCSTVGKQDRE